MTLQSLDNVSGVLHRAQAKDSIRNKKPQLQITGSDLVKSNSLYCIAMTLITCITGCKRHGAEFILITTLVLAESNSINYYYIRNEIA